MLGIGFDTGGTCTDAVLYDLDSKEIIGTGKALTTKYNLEIGIANALDQLPQEYMSQVGSISLSTTLATNACVEDKGCRAKLLLLGSSNDMLDRLKHIYKDYGMDDLSQIVVFEGLPENYFSNAFDPDWDDLERNAKEYFKECDAVGIVQLFPKANGGRFELTALRILKKELTIPLTIAYEFLNETDVLKTIASTLLNARLIPLIVEFIEAVKRVMRLRGIHAPLSIVRSDGTLMSEDMARSCPVETLLCGPAASVIGGCELAHEDSAILLDMGGTTSDIAIIENKQPVMSKNGILIGQWRTAISGLDVTATALGGDSAVRFKNDELYLDAERVIPISVLAEEYESVMPALRRVCSRPFPHTRWLHEFYVLQKEIVHKTVYSDFELRVCEVLRDGPLCPEDLALELDTDIYFMDLTRLIKNGIIMKSGLTPTDMMVIRGDYPRYDPEAAQMTAAYVAMNVKEKAEDMPDLVYEMVEEKMYKYIARVIMQYQYPKQKEFFEEESLEGLLNLFYSQAKLKMQHPELCENLAAELSLTTSIPLLGVGAPTHVFLPKVAKLLGTRAVVPDHAKVANALGAISARMIARADVSITPKYEMFSILGYEVPIGFERRLITDLDRAVERGKEEANRIIKDKAKFQGLGEHPEIKIDVEEKRFGSKKSGILYEIIIHASAEKA